jgi:hypothetical protein
MILKQLKVNREILKLTISKFVIYRMVIYQQIRPKTMEHPSFLSVEPHPSALR